MIVEIVVADAGGHERNAAASSVFEFIQALFDEDLSDPFFLKVRAHGEQHDLAVHHNFISSGVLTLAGYMRMRYIEHGRIHLKDKISGERFDPVPEMGAGTESDEGLMLLRFG